MPKSKHTPKERPTSLRILKVRRGRKSITIDYKNGDESHSLTSRDNPLKAFNDAIDALPSLVGEILGLPASYIEGVKANGVTLTDGENEQVTLVASKPINECNSPFNIATPLRFMNQPEKEGSYTPPLSDKQVALIDEVVEQAKAYVLGNRAQGQIAFEDDEGDDPDANEAGDPKIEELPLAAPDMPHNRKRRGKQAKDAAAAG